ncbi:MAG: DUF2165 domain-containing protein [Burkholderiaceae bacterium]
MMIRLSKASMILAIALFASLVAFGNITDYGTNFAFVHHVFLMDTIFPDSRIGYRAIDSALLHHAGYCLIIALEALTALLCWIGGWQLLKARHVDAQHFHAAKRVAVAGLTLGFLTWQVGFMSIGGEWFGMWMSKEWNGVPSAFRFVVTILAVLIYLTMKNDELEPAR